MMIPYGLRLAAEVGDCLGIARRLIETEGWWTDNYVGQRGDKHDVVTAIRAAHSSEAVQRLTADLLREQVGWEGLGRWNDHYEGAGPVKRALNDAEKNLDRLMGVSELPETG